MQGGNDVSEPLGTNERRAEVVALLNSIVDPCSAAVAVPLGLEEMGIARVAALKDDTVEVVLLPTTPGCLMTGFFVERIRTLAAGLEWCDQVKISFEQGSEVWDEERIAPAARRRLEMQRTQRRELIQTRRTS